MLRLFGTEKSTGMIHMAIRVLAVAALFGAVLYGEDITIPLEGGSILIKDATFTRVAGSTSSGLSFTIVNNTTAGWDLKLRLVFSSRCDDHEASQSSRAFQVSLRQGASKPYEDDSPQYSSTTGSGCVLEKMVASLISAENRRWRINGTTGERTDLGIQHEIDAQAQAKKDAAEAALQKRLAAEQKKKAAEQETRNAEERRRVRAACSGIYQNTVDKKVKDLTVGEEQQVRACQALGLYPPR
jgi:hypothetical protein